MITQEIKQELLDSFVTILNGKGRSLTRQGEGCLYVNENHPGCAIGCQPRFDAIRNDITEYVNNGTIDDIIGEDTDDIGDRFCNAFCIGPPLSHERMDDVAFLSSLQKLHDASRNWRGLQLIKLPVEEFCTQFSLTVPESDYITESEQ